MPEQKELVVLILGGTNKVARALVKYLLGGVVPLASVLGLSPIHAECTRYLDKPFLGIFNDPASRLEYKQVNLLIKEKHLEVFTPPTEWRGVRLRDDGTGISAGGTEGEGGGGVKEGGGVGFDVVFDLTGETAAEKPELIQIQNTYNLALSLATSAVSLPPAMRPQAYIRLTFPYYEMKSSSPQAEGADLKPDGTRGRWWHETLRGLGRLQDQGLNLGVARCAAAYGRGGWGGEVVARLVVGHVYSYLKEEMKFLHNSDLRIHTVHTSDIASALYTLARYLILNPQSTKASTSAQSDLFVPITFPFSSPTSLLGKRSSVSDSWKSVPTVVPEKEVVKVILFNIVDNGDSTQEKLAKAVAEVWGVKWGFLNSTVALLVQQFAKTDFSEMVEDVNEKHVEAWSAMLEASKPPITSTPITPFLDEHAFKKHAIYLDGSKAKKILGWTPSRPSVEVEELRRIVEDFQQDGIWPRLE